MTMQILRLIAALVVFGLAIAVFLRPPGQTRDLLLPILVAWMVLVALDVPRWRAAVRAWFREKSEEQTKGVTRVTFVDRPRAHVPPERFQELIRQVANEGRRTGAPVSVRVNQLRPDEVLPPIESSPDSLMLIRPMPDYPRAKQENNRPPAEEYWGGAEL